MSRINKELTDTLWEAISTLEYEGIALLDKEGNYYALNRAHELMYGYGKNELNGKTWRILYSEAQAVELEKKIMPIVFKKGRWKGALTGLKKDGTQLTAQVTLTLIKSGTLEGGLFCLCYDHTALAKKKTLIANEVKELLGK